MVDATTSCLFRIFVSSTFSDFSLEREVLRKRVFQPMSERLLERGFLLEVVDLRWGISAEAAMGQQTAQICLDQIRLCQERSPKPNFLILAGDRYGWCPLPVRLPGDAFEQLLGVLDGVGQDLLRRWYLLDKNALPPERVLKPRLGPFAVEEVWEKEEKQVRAALLDAAARLGPDALPREISAGLGTSATEQEIEQGLLRADNGESHVFAFIRSIVDLEDVMAGGRASRLARYVDWHDNQWDKQTWRRQRALCQRVVEQMERTSPARLFRQSCRCLEDQISTEHLREAVLPEPESCAGTTPDTLAAAVWCALWQVMLPEMKSRRAARSTRAGVGEKHTELTRERAQRCRGKSRADRVAEMARKVGQGESDSPFLVHGPSGMGKTTLLAAFVDHFREKHDEWQVVERFIGTGPETTNTVSLLESLSKQLWGKEFDGLARPIGDPLAVSASVFLRALRRSSQPRLLIVLDALDQLPPAEQARLADWLPRQLPSTVQMVVSTTPPLLQSPALQAIPQACRFPLEGLDRADGGAMLDGLLAQAHRRLTDGQRDQILDTGDPCKLRLPLWLDLAGKQACRWTSQDTSVRLAKDATQLLADWFDDLARTHGSALVSAVLAFLAGSRRGLTEGALWSLCSAAPEVYLELLRSLHHVPEEFMVPELGLAPGADIRAWLSRVQRDERMLARWAESLVAKKVTLPTSLWVRLHEDLAMYLAERESGELRLVDFHHARVRDAAATRTGDLTQAHRRMADYFQERWPKGDRLALDEIAEQLARSKQAQPLVELLTNPSWQVLVLRHLGIASLEAAFALADQANVATELRPDLACLLDAITESAHVVAGHRPAGKVGPDASLLPAQLLGRLGGRRGPLLDPFLEKLIAWHSGKPQLEGEGDLLLPVSACLPAISERLLRTIAGHERCVSAVALSPDGHLGVSCDDWRILAWDTASGVERLRVDVFRSEIKPDGIRGVVLAPGANHVLSWAGDQKLRRHDLSTGELRDEWPDDVERCCGNATGTLVTVDGSRNIHRRQWASLGADLRGSPELLFHSDRPVTALAMDGSQPVVAIGFDDGGLAVWDVSSRACLGGGKAPGPITALALDAGGEWVWWGTASGEIGSWRFRERAPQPWSGRHRAQVTGLALLSKGRLVSVGYDSCIRLWQRNAGEALDLPSPGIQPIEQVPGGHCFRIRAVSSSGDRSMFATASDDTTVRVWDADRIDVEAERPGHRSLITATAVDQLRGRALTASRDGALGLWGLEDGRSLGVLGVHSTAKGLAWQPGDAATSLLVCHQIALAPDGRHAVSVGHDRLCWWDLDHPNQGCVRTMDAPHEYVTGVFWSYDGTMLVHAPPHLFRRVGDGWQPMELPTGFADRIAVSPDGRFLAAVPGDNVVVLARFGSDHIEPLYRYLFHEKGTRAISATFLRDSRTVLTVGHDRCLRWWEVESGKSLGVVGRHEREIHDVVVSADGQIAVTVADDRWLAVWDLPRRKLRTCFRAEGAVVRVSTDANAEIIVSGDEAGRPIILRRIPGTAAQAVSQSR